MYIKDIFKYKNHQHCIINILKHNFDLFDYLNTKYKSVDNPIQYKYWNNSYFFDYIHIHKKKDIYKSFLNDITNRNLTNDLIYLYFYNFNDANIHFQSYLKYVMENCHSIKIIIATNKYNSINISIKNQCIIIPYIYSNKLSDKYESTITNIIYDIFIKYDFIKFKNKIKLFVYNLFKNEIVIDPVVNTFINFICSKPYITKNIKFKIIKIAANINHKISTSYNKLVLYELLFIKIYTIIKPCLDTFYNL